MAGCEGEAIPGGPAGRYCDRAGCRRPVGGRVCARGSDAPEADAAPVALAVRDSAAGLGGWRTARHDRAAETIRVRVSGPPARLTFPWW